MLHIKFHQVWPTGLRDIQVRKYNIFVVQWQVTQKVSRLIRPEIKLDRAFMPVLATSNFNDDSIKINELEWRQHFPIISLWEIFRRSRAANSVVSGPIWQKFELIRDFFMSSLPASIKRIGSKTTEKRWRHRCPHYK